MAAAALADVIPVRQFLQFDFWREMTFDRKELASWSAPRDSVLTSIHAEPAIVGLTVQSSDERSGRPARLALALQGQSEGAVVIITGVVPGMGLSKGEPFGVTAWRVPAMDLDDIWIGPPDNFAGSVDLVVELRLPDDRVVDRHAVHLEWLP